MGYGLHSLQFRQYVPSTHYEPTSSSTFFLRDEICHSRQSAQMVFYLVRINSYLKQP